MTLKPEEREVKAGDVLIALRDDQCLVKGKRYMVFEDTPGQSAIKCEMSTEPRHYLNYDWLNRTLAYDEGAK